MERKGPSWPQSSQLRQVVTSRADLVRPFALFSELSDEDREKIVGIAYEQRYRRGKTIFFSGDPITRIILLTSGLIRVSQMGLQGAEVIPRFVVPGESLCVECFPKYTHCSTAQAVEDSTALIWEASQFQALRERFPVLGRNVYCVLLHTLRELEVRYREISTNKVSSRLSQELLRLHRRFGKQPDEPLEIALSQRDLAQSIGTTIYTVNRLLNAWEEQGILRPKREAVQLIDIPALRKLAEAE